MSVGGILMTDLARMAANPPPMPAGRVTHDQKLIDDFEYLQRHGETRDQAAERGRMLRREAFEADAVADLDANLESIAGTSDAARHKHQTFALILDRERDKLSALESRKAQFTEYVNAPARTRSKISEAISRTKAWLLGGGDEPQIDRQALDAELALASHKAAAAQEAIADIERQIEVQTIRVNRLQEAERGFVCNALAEVSADLVQALARKRGEVEALERLLKPLQRYGVATHGKPETVELRWKHSWPDVAAALRANPAADVSRLLPKVPA
jgi:chromosome segregation ATPase